MKLYRLKVELENFRFEIEGFLKAHGTVKLLVLLFYSVIAYFYILMTYSNLKFIQQQKCSRGKSNWFKSLKSAV